MHLALLACIFCIGHVTAAPLRCPPITTSPAVQSVTCLHHLSIVDCSTDMADGTLAVFVCNKFHYAGKLTSTTAVCNRNATWTYSSTACQLPAPAVKCPPITSSPAVQSVSCLKDLNYVDCTEAMAEGTIAVMECTKYHYAGKEASMAAVCSRHGTWMYSAETCKIPDCGRQNSVNVMVNGEQVQDGEVPWNINIYSRSDSVWKYECGGTLISSVHVITRAYCVMNWYHGRQGDTNLRLAARKLVTNFTWTDPNAQWRHVIRINKHEQYVYGETVDYNIALLEADSSFELNKFLSPACVDWSGQLPAPTPSDVLIAAAYKKGSSDESPLHLVASQGYSIIQDHVDCRDSAWSSRRQYVTDGHFCARTVTNQTCNYSPGAGLTLGYKTPDGAKQFLWGVETDWLYGRRGDGGCVTDIGTAFTNLTQYLLWIRDHS